MEAKSIGEIVSGLFSREDWMLVEEAFTEKNPNKRRKDVTDRFLTPQWDKIVEFFGQPMDKGYVYYMIEFILGSVQGAWKNGIAGAYDEMSKSVPVLSPTKGFKNN